MFVFIFSKERTKYVKKLLITFLAILTLGLALAGCGDQSQAQTTAPTATLALIVDKTEAAAGSDTITATVALSRPAAGVTVDVDMIYNDAVVSTVSGSTNDAGVAIIPVPVELVPADRTVYLQAKSSGMTSSSSVAVAVRAPVLTVTLANYSITTAAATRVVFTNVGVKFTDFNGNAIPFGLITFRYAGNSGAPGTLYHVGIPMIVGTAGGSFPVMTDVSGFAPLALEGAINTMPPSGDTVSTTFNYTVSVEYGGFVYTLPGSVRLTVTSI